MVDRPVMVLRGADDLISSKAYAGEFARTFSRGVFVQISSAGHLAHYDNPNGVLTALTRFCAPGR
jgi:pimeloyl-ACP methyl ester carboxylesterase